MTTPDPGWYDDPQDENAQRYWDGQDWTPHRHRKPLSPQTQAPVTPPLPPPSNVPPPQLPPSTVATPTRAPDTTKGLSGRSKVGLVVAGLALLLVIAALVTGRVLLGTFLPGLLLVAVIAIVAVTVAVRSGQPVPRKAMIVTATVLVVAVAVPASLKVVYPVYHHFFGDGTNQASPSAHSSSSHSAAGPSSARTGSTHADAGQLKVTLNGVDPSHGSLATGGVKCSTQGGEVIIAATGGAGNESYRAKLTDSDPPQVKSVQLGYVGYATSWGYQPNNGGVGDATATKHDKGYTITGHATMQGNSSRDTEPFEFDATCPAPASYTSGSAGSYSMTLNGQNIAQDNDVQCAFATHAMSIIYSGVDGEHSGNFGVLNPGSNPELSSAKVTMYDATAQASDGGVGTVLEWNYENTHTANTGLATVTPQGNSYKITGKLFLKREAQKTVPFEFDATCP
jgi:Mycobacterium 19 kDa lipoprotein antigen/Protein of unknown function (DUF2510)